MARSEEPANSTSVIVVSIPIFYASLIASVSHLTCNPNNATNLLTYSLRLGLPERNVKRKGQTSGYSELACHKWNALE